MGLLFMRSKGKKCSVFIVLTLFCAIMTGCAGNIDKVNKSASTENEMADECFSEIRKAIQEQDIDALLNLFSIEVKATLDIELFRQYANKLFELYDGEAVSYKRDLSTSTTENRHIHETLGFYDIETANGTHHLLFINTDRNKDNEDAEGISMIVYVSDELYNSDGFYWKYGSREPGLYIDLALEP